MYIYLHLPFCSSICNYCDFPKVLYDKKYISNYLTSLKKEVINRYQQEPVKTIYIGGGTPTCLDIQELKQLLDITKYFKKEKNIEFTIESNIESLDQEKIKLLKQYRVNRISLGVQSLNKRILSDLNRHHTKNMVKEVIKALKRNDITNISIDYIYGVNSDINIIKEDLDEIIKLEIPHISCYSLIIEDGTIFKINNRKYIDDKIDLEMYNYIENFLEKNNYIHYEISNYAKNNYQSSHNLNYWNNGEYYGFGLGATSYLNNTRRTNTKNLTKYLNNTIVAEEIYEDKQLQISNEFILGLRKIDGISKNNFKNKYKKDIKEIKEVKELLSKGYLEETKTNIRIPKKYIYTSNEILISFIS